jgi:phosphatidate cytidylyltransferase
MKALLLLFSILFTIGAIGNHFSIKKHPANKKIAWKKYFIYLIIVLINTSVFASSQFYLKLTYIFIIGFICTKELLSACYPKKLWGLLTTAFLLLVAALISFMYYDADTMIILYLIVLIFDGFSQIGGQLFGKKPIVKTISPNKTIGGFIIGAISAYAIVMLFQYNQLKATFDIQYYSIFFLITLIGAFCGDIGASYIKRKANIKDFATYIPGHGGVLDRMDSWLGALITISISFIIKKIVDGLV